MKWNNKTKLTVNNNGTRAALPSILTMPSRNKTSWQTYKLSDKPSDEWVGFSESGWSINKTTLASKPTPTPTGQNAFSGSTEANAAFSCMTIKTNYPQSPSGTYWVHFGGSRRYTVYFDMVSDGGGWMLVLADTGRNEVYGLPKRLSFDR